ncbi:hypothetical protein [Pontibacter liquoris]|nr:hypothetical protein [Pontibacter liquoris]
MKECCRTGDEEPEKKGSKWLRYLVIAVVVLAILVVLFNQMNY